MDRIEADDFTVAGEFGQSTKQQHLDRSRGRQQSEKPEEGNRRFDNRQFRFYGDVALITETAWSGMCFSSIKRAAFSRSATALSNSRSEM